MAEEITITVTGKSGSGKTTIATMIRNALAAQDIDVKLRLSKHEMIPCPTTQRQRLYYLISQGLAVKIVEVDEES